MQYFTRLPRWLLLCEWLGVALVVLALIVTHHNGSAPEIDSHTGLARALLITGLVLILPAAVVIFWRGIRALLPERRR